MKLTSHEIGAGHERSVRDLLAAWRVPYVAKKKVRTDHGAEVELDFWLPPTESRPGVVIECKEFGVAAKSTADSRRRKAQEALYLLVQLRRHCPETKGARLILLTGKEGFLPGQLGLLKAELGPDFNIISISIGAVDELRECLGTTN